MGLVSHMAPYTAAPINTLLASSAIAAANHCIYGTNGTQCNMFWTTDQGPATLGVGQQMSALNVFNANMMKFTSQAVVTSNSGGTSVGDPNAGSPTSDQIDTYCLRLARGTDDRIGPATTGDKVFAGILTSFSSVLSVGFAAWLAI
jgi:mannan endo-1,6-alpha-mannosidase